MRVWPSVKASLTDAMDDPLRTGPEDIQRRLLCGTAVLWRVREAGRTRAAVLTEILLYPRSKSMKIWLCAGEGVFQWVHLIGVLEEEARRQGCRMVEILGRRGWGRLLPAYRERAVLLEKELP